MTSRRYRDRPTPPPTTGYATDVNDTEWTYLAPIVAQKPGSGKKRTIDTRAVLNAIFYRVRTGCQWRMLPKEFPKWGNVTYYYYMWRNDGTLERINTTLRRTLRQQANRDPEPSVAVIDSQSVPATEMGGEKGFDPHKQIKGRKRTLLVDTLGLVLLVVVCAASLVDSTIAECIANDMPGRFPRLKTILADRGYRNGCLIDLFKQLWQCLFKITPRPQETRAFVPEPQRWKVERTLGWLNWSRLLSKEYERTTESSEADVYLASIRLMLQKIPNPKT